MIQKNILILGGSRFIGYLMLTELSKEGHNITIFNRQLRIPPGPFPKTTRLVKGDRNRPEDLERLFNQSYDAVIDISGYNPSQVELIIKKYLSKIGQYIFISTSSVYKSPLLNPMTEESPRIFLKNTYGLIITVLLSAFGRAISEVGAVMIVGGNIDHVTRVMTTSIALEVSKGNLSLALGLGVILVILSVLVNGMVHFFKGNNREGISS